MTMIRLKLIRAGFFAATMALAAPIALLQGCEREDGPMEELGEDLDEAAEDVRKPFEDLGE